MSVLSDKVAVVTGASSGIGEAVALELGRRNVKLVCAARRQERLKGLEDKIIAAGGHCLGVQCDVTRREDVERMIEKAAATFGPVDCLVNNAGVMPISFMDRCDVENWELMIDVNIKGVLYGVAAVLPAMLERNSGHIVNISSVAGRRVYPGATVYSATKYAVHAISEGLRAELATHDIRVTCVAPGWVETELQQQVPDERIMRRWRDAQAESDVKPLSVLDVAHTVVYALESPPHVGIGEVVVRPTRQQT